MANNRESFSRLLGFIEKKRNDDPKGFTDAFSRGPSGMKAYLALELQKNGIDTKSILWEDLFQKYKIMNAQEAEDFFNKSSIALDDIIFGPWFMKNATEFEKNVLVMVADFGRFRILNNRLRTVKLISFCASVLSFGALLSALSGRRIVSAVFYGIASMDLFTIAYNCYIKNYICLAMEKLGGNMSRVGETFFAWMATATGLTSSKDPFAIIKNEISWEILFKNTISIKLYLKGKEAIRDAKKVD